MVQGFRGLGRLLRAGALVVRGEARSAHCVSKWFLQIGGGPAAPAGAALLAPPGAGAPRAPRARRRRRPGARRLGVQRGRSEEAQITPPRLQADIAPSADPR